MKKGAAASTANVLFLVDLPKTIKMNHKHRSEAGAIASSSWQFSPHVNRAKKREKEG